MAFRNMCFSYQRADQFYFRLSLIFYLLVAIPMVPFVVVYLQMHQGKTAPVMAPEHSPAITAVMTVLAFGLVVVGMQLFKRQIVLIRTEETLRQKLNLFLSASLMQYSCMEAATIIALTGLYLVRTTFFVLLYLGMVIIFAQVRPELRRICRQLRLTKQEEEVVYQRKEIT